jgi:hypothetical protein
MNNSYYENDVCSEVTVSAGKWHYVRVFCAFFSLIATFASLAMAIDTHTQFGWLLGIMWFLGVVAALLVSPGKFFAFGWGLVSRCAVFAWLLLPFPFDLIPFLILVPLSIVVALICLTIVPAIFTIYTYISDISDYSTDSKKEWMAVLSGIGTVIICAGVFFGLNAIGRAVEAPQMENSFDAYKIYSEYAKENEGAREYSEIVLDNPVFKEKSDGGYVREHRYEFEQNDGLLEVKYDVTIVFEYMDRGWVVSYVREIGTPVGFSNIDGTWTGTGTYPGNLSAGNIYTLSFGFSKEGGESGTLEVSHGDVLLNHMQFTVEIGQFTDSASLYYDKELGTLVQLKLVLNEPVTFETFGVKNTVTEVECFYCFSNNSIILKTFKNGLVLSPNV